MTFLSLFIGFPHLFHTDSCVYSFAGAYRVRPARFSASLRLYQPLFGFLALRPAELLFVVVVV